MVIERLDDHEHILNPENERCCVCFLPWELWRDDKKLADPLDKQNQKTHT